MMQDPNLGPNFYDGQGDYWYYDSHYDSYKCGSKSVLVKDTFEWLRRNGRLTDAQATQYQYNKLDPINTLNTTNTKMKHTLFLIYAIYNARQTADATGTDTTPKPALVVAPEYILAMGAVAAQAILSRKIPDDMMDKLEFIDSIVKAL